MNTKKTTLLKDLILSKELSFLMEAHNGLSAKIVEEAGFKGIWGSGLAISASLGVRDNNEASWTQVLDVCEFMSDNSEIPILLDGDTGFGNFNNMRRLVKKLEQRDIAGVCIEDKLFPKTNSFIGGEAQPLADIDEFCGKIKSAKDTQKDDDFVLVARVEAFIAGWGLNEALRRANAYKEAGADAILVHSKKTTPSDIEMFMKEWGDRHPIVIVPTKYYSAPTELFSDLGISTIIWANHNIRTAITAMQNTVKQIFLNKNISCVQDNISSVAEVFRLQGADELKEAEKKYLPNNAINSNVIVLAASQGNLGDITQEIPKTLIKVNNEKSILETQIDSFNKVGIKDISVVRGFQKDKINFANITPIDNDIFEKTKELYSFYLAKDKISENTIISYGDIVFKDYILNELLNDNSDITIIVDADWNYIGNNIDYVKTDVPYSKNVYSLQSSLVDISCNIPIAERNGEFIGLWKVNKNGAILVKESLEYLKTKQNFNSLTLQDLFKILISKTKIKVKFIKGSWLDVDEIVDLQKIGNF